MSRFNELGKARLTILETLIENQELCKALKYNESNFIDQPDIEDTSILIGANIFPYSYIPDLTKTQSNFLTFSLRDYRPVDNTFKSGILHFMIIMHKNNIQTDYEMLRYDFILSRVDELFNASGKLGIGKLQFAGMDETYINEQFVGFYIKYRLWDFN